MKAYLNNFLKMHINCWYMHLATLLIMPSVFFTTLIIGQSYDFYFGDGFMFYFLCSITFAALATPLLLWPNYKSARSFMKSYGDGSSTIRVIGLTILNQLFFIMVFYLICYVVISLLLI